MHFAKELVHKRIAPEISRKPPPKAVITPAEFIPSAGNIFLATRYCILHLLDECSALQEKSTIALHQPHRRLPMFFKNFMKFAALALILAVSAGTAVAARA